MKMSIAERVALLDVLPKEGNFVTLKALRVLREDVSLSDEENKLVGMTIEPSEDGKGFYRWDGDKDPNKDIKIPGTLYSVIVDTLITLDKQKRLTEAHLPIYERFVEQTDPDVL